MAVERLNREQIAQILPHRDDMALLDEAALLEDGTAEGIYRVRGDEFFLRGHFPGNPVVPGVIQCEIIAQASCMLMKELGRETYFSKGSEENIKITTLEDLRIFKALLHTRQDDWIKG